jgi:type I restriction enzyme S subunit
LLGPKHTTQANDVLFARLGPSMGNRKSVLVGSDIEIAWCSNEFHVLRAKPGIPPEYILFLIKSETFISQAKAKARGATPSRLRLHERDLPNLKVPRHSKQEILELSKKYIEGRLRSADLVRQAEEIRLEVAPNF